MRTNRRAMIAGLTGLGLAGFAAPRVARAAAGPLQDIYEDPVEDFGPGLGPDDDNYSPSSLDLSGGGFGKVCVVVTQLALPGLVGFGQPIAKLPDVVKEGAANDFRLRGLCVQQHGATVMALFQLEGGPGPESWHIGQTAAEYQALVARAEREGLEPVSISVDNMDGAPRFTTLLRRSSTAWVARHGLKPSDLTPLTAALKAKGFRLARFAPYLDAGELRFAVLFRPAGPHGWQAWLGDEDPGARDKEFRAQGFALLQAVSYEDGGKRRWACIWQKAEGAAQDYYWGN